MAHPDTPEAVDVPVIDYDDDESAAAALAQHLDGEPEEDEIPEGDEPEEEVEAEEGDEPEAGETDEEEGEEGEPEQPAIEPPASLTAEEKAAWAQLPPEAQLMLKSVEARRTTEIQQGLEKARSAQREAESAAAQRVAEAQKLFAEQQTALAQRYMPQKPDPRHYPDWQTYSAAQSDYEARAAQHQQLVQQLSGLHEEATKEHERLEAEALQQQWKAVQSDLPEAADPAQWQDLMGKLSPLALELGYPEELLADATPVDIRAIKRAAGWKEKAEKYDALMSRQMAKVRSGKSAKPNAAQPVGSGKARAKTNAIQRLQQTGSDADALAAFEAIGF